MMNQSKPKQTQVSKKKTNVKPEWNDNITDISRYQLSKVEQLQKKVSCSSKNILAAKERVIQVQEQLKSGIIPSSYSDAIKHKQKKKDMKEEYRQKAKAIVYPVLACTPSVPQIRKQNPQPKVKEEKLTEFTMPLSLANKAVPMSFTASNEPKVKSISTLIPRDNFISTEDNTQEKDEDYLSCKENIEKLKKLKENLNNEENKVNYLDYNCDSKIMQDNDNNEKRINYLDCDYNLKILNDPKHNIYYEENYLDSKEKNLNEDRKESNYLDCENNLKTLNELKGKLSGDNVGLEDCMANLNAILDLDKTPNINDVMNEQNNPLENDDIDFDRINKLIAQTNKDLSDLNIDKDPVHDAEEEQKVNSYEDKMSQMNSNYSVTEINSTVPMGNIINEEDILTKYTNSFTHTNKGNTRIPQNKENDFPNSGTIISRKINNKTEINISGDTIPRKLLMEAEYYNAQI